MSTKHTPGPWQLGTEKTHVFSGKVLIAGCGGYSDNFTKGLREIQQANARLIAAAPDLLHAAQIALEVLNSYAKHDIGAKDELRQAITKATGQD